MLSYELIVAHDHIVIIIYDLHVNYRIIIPYCLVMSKLKTDPDFGALWS